MIRKNFFNLIIIIIPLLSSCSHKSSELQPKRTVIAGKVENMPENATSVLVNFCDPLSERHRFAQDLTTSGGTFCVAHDYVFAQNLAIQYDNSFINLYVTPGDSVFVTIDGSIFQQYQRDAVTFSGDNAKINEQLFRWTVYAYELPIPEFNPAAPPGEYLSSIKQSFSAMQDTIAAYARRNEMNDFVKQWAFRDYKFIVANFLLDYADKESKWGVFTDSIFDIYNDKNFQTMYFDAHVYACTDALVSGSEKIQELLQQKEYNAALQAVIKELSERTPRGTVRDMMLYLFSKKIINEKPELYDSIPEWKAVFSQPVFNEKIKSLAQTKLAGAKKPVPLTGKTLKGVSYLDVETQQVTSLPEVEVLPYLVERYKNKVLYIDVWATWCGPCREQMKYAPTLHEYFSRKEVVFVNLCLQSTVANWVKTVSKDRIKGENYYLNENATKIFMGAHNINGFPTYMLIDKSGQLRAPVARPSNTSTAIEQIDKLL
ncbi:MAG: TlpA family protein disulfide reductase [Prevotellaceae bacterium]|jgi:thiol-disulfide isomerase/thioredoxin|nr:TlpA family protein disulfide reductase [Prevotellaceae bacterium]